MTCHEVIKKKTFHFPVLFFEICGTYDGLVSKALPLRTSSPGRFFVLNDGYDFQLEGMIRYGCLVNVVTDFDNERSGDVVLLLNDF